MSQTADMVIFGARRVGVLQRLQLATVTTRNHQGQLESWNRSRQL